MSTRVTSALVYYRAIQPSLSPEFCNGIVRVKQLRIVIPVIVIIPLQRVYVYGLRCNNAVYRICCCVRLFAVSVRPLCLDRRSRRQLARALIVPFLASDDVFGHGRMSVDVNALRSR